MDYYKLDEYNNMSNEEIIYLILDFIKDNSEMSYNLVYNELKPLYLKAIKMLLPKHIKSSFYEDILQELPLVIDETLSKFEITLNSSFKTYFFELCKTYINKFYKERYFECVKTPLSYKEKIYLDFRDVEDCIEETYTLDISELPSYVSKYIGKSIKQVEYDMFSDFYGIENECLKLKDLSIRYKKSMSSISRTIKRVRQILESDKNIIALGKEYGLC